MASGAIKDYKELAKSQEASEEFLRKQARKLIKKFVVSGDFNPRFSTIKKSGDLDVRTSLGLFKLAGFDISKIEFIKKGKNVPGGLHIDVGGKDGVVLDNADKGSEYWLSEEFKKNKQPRALYFDHHGKNSLDGNSATKMAYEFLVKDKFLKPSRGLRSLIEFVNHEDNKTFPNEAKLWHKSDRMILGLFRKMSFEQLLDFFEQGGKADQLLSDAELEKFGLLEASAEHRALIERSDEALKKYQQEGNIIDSPRYGKIVVDIGHKIPGGFNAVKAYGAGLYINWSPRSNSFFISSINKPLAETFGQGFSVREKMWIHPREDNQPISISLKSVLKKLTQDPKFEGTGKLNEYLKAS